MKVLKLIGYRFMAGVFLLAGTAVRSPAEILTFYSDTGLAAGFNAIPVYSGCAFPSANAVADGQNKDLSTVPAGLTSWKLSDASSADCYFGWGLGYPGLNLSRFSAGELRFWIYSSLANIKLEIKDTNGVIVLTQDPIGLTAAQLNRWVEIRVPFAGNLQGTGLSQVANPFLFTATSSPGTFYIDQVRYVDSSVPSPHFSVAIRNISDNSTANEITWGSVGLPAHWVRADQYLALDVDPDAPAWGIQVYTDNASGSANPRYTGSGIASGLIDQADTTKRLPLAWATRPETSTITVVAADPQDSSDPNSFQWLFIKDQSEPSFQNGDPYGSVLTNLGLHYGQSPTEFGAENPPYRVYFQADFAKAVTPRTYRTSALRIEYFTP